jgi:DNA-binding NarL/FixJ family response regulator
MSLTEQPSADLVSRLSPREMQIAEALWAEQPDKISTAALGIAHSTLRTHLLRIFVKLGVHTRLGVVRQYERHRLSTIVTTHKSRHARRSSKP